MTTASRNFSTITPSAKMLVLLKGYTNIPYARQVAGWILAPEPYAPDYQQRDLGFWGRVIHFEQRYWSVTNLLEELQAPNILELSSGFSMRGLAATRKTNCHYIDTDLPEMIETKKAALEALKESPGPGTLEVLPLNAVDAEQFDEVVSHFPPGKLAIVNEGLLMYLDPEEKRQLFSNIHRALEQRGGWWITADVYTRQAPSNLKMSLDPRLEAFLEAHRTEEKKFEDFGEAETVFRENGFVIDKVGKANRHQLSSLKYFIRSMPLWMIFKMRKAGRMQATWRLVPLKDN